MMSRMLAALAAAVLLAGCGGPSVMSEPMALGAKGALARAADARLAATLEAVIVPGGPGTWANNPEWDEYFIVLGALTDEPVTVTDLAVFDALEQRNPRRDDLSGLQQTSRELERRYQASTSLAKDETTGAWMVAGGMGAAALGSAVGAAGAVGAVLSGGAAAGGAALASTAFLAGGVILAGVGAAHLMNNAEVRREILRRHSPLPATVARAQDARLDVFFPVTPLPRSIEISYTVGTARHRLNIDIRQALAKAHVVPTPR